MANRYWVASTTSNWNNTSNWSTTSGGSGGASVPGSSDDVIFDSNGSGSCNVDSNVDVLSFNFASYAGTFSASTYTFAVAGDMSASGTTAIIDLGSSNWTVGGNYNMRNISGSSTEGTSTLRMTSTTLVGWYWKPSGGNFYSITLAPNAQVSQGRNLYITGSFSLESGATWAAGVYRPLIRANASLTLGPNSSITTTTGYLELRPDGTGTRTGNATASVGSFKTISGAGDPQTPWTIPVATYVGDFVFRQNDSTYGGIWRFEGDTVIEGNISTAMSKSTNETIDTATNNVNLTLKGDVDITPSIGSITWSAGSGTITLSNTSAQSINFNAQSIEDIIIDKSAGSVTLTSNLTTDSLTLTDGTVDINGYDLTTTGNFTQGVATIVQDSNGSGLITVGGDFRINGSNDSPTIWNDADLNISGSALATNITVSGSNASSGTYVTASRNSIDNGDNVGWTFRNAYSNIYKKLTLKSNSKLTIKGN
jgi:hypothetical protein